MINNVWVEINIKDIKDRYNKLSGSTKAEIIPVIKNNANGLGFKETLKIFKELGVRMVATSYASEFYFYAKDDEGINKLSWIWQPCEELTKVKNLILCCKNFEQLNFCIDKNIPFHIVFNIGMNRGGFTLSNIYKLKYLAGNKWIVATHCPYSNITDINIYFKNVNKLREEINKHGVEIEYMHAANSVVFRECPDCHLDGVRLGEVLLLPNDDKFGRYDPLQVKTSILDIMYLEKGDNIGYNNMILENRTKVAVIPVGYYNFEKISQVLINGCRMNVLAQLHDLSMVEIKGGEIVSIGDEVTINNLALSQGENWNKCIQRTFKFNQDLIGYKYKE